MDVREKLVELLWEYDQMRMMRMSIEECVDRLIEKGVTVNDFRVPTKDEWMERYCTKKRLAGYQKEKSKSAMPQPPKGE